MNAREDKNQMSARGGRSEPGRHGRVNVSP
jgi:hypothetical protein